MGRKKQEEIVETIENLDEEMVSETETVEEDLALDSENEVTEAVEKEEKQKPARRSRKTPKEETAQHPLSLDPLVSEDEKPQEEKPKRQSRRGKKNADTPEAAIELTAEAMRKSMEEMVQQWEKIQQISEAVSSQLEKVSHIVKPAVQDFTDTQDLLRPKTPPSQFAHRFMIAASVVSVLFSVVSLSLSQSARQVALNSEAAHVANNQLFSNRPTPGEPKSAPELAVNPSDSLLQKRSNDAPYGSRQKNTKFRK